MIEDRHFNDEDRFVQCLFLEVFPLLVLFCNVACRGILLKNTMASHVWSFDERLCRFQFRADDSEPPH